MRRQTFLLRFTAALLCVISLLNLASCGILGRLMIDPNAKLSDEEPLIFALTMTAYSAAWEDGTDITLPIFAWETAGWYSAYLYRTEGRDSLSLPEVKAICQAVYADGGFPECPEDWRGEGLITSEQVDDDLIYRFPLMLGMIDEMLGITVEWGYSLDGNTANTWVIYHYDDGGTEQYNFRFVFVPNDRPLLGEAGKYRHAFRLAAAAFFENPEVSDETNVSGDDFVDSWEGLEAEGITLDMIIEQNLLSNMMKFGDDITWHEMGVGYEVRGWAGMFGDKPAFINCHLEMDDQGEYVPSYDGVINGMYFFCDEMTREGRHVVQPYSEEYDDDGLMWYEQFFMPFFSMPLEVVEYREKEHIVLGYTDGEEYANSINITVNYGTLRIEHVRITYGMEYADCEVKTGDIPYDGEILDMWDDTRSVTVVRSYTNDAGNEATEKYTREVPKGWEVVPEGIFNAEEAMYLDKDHSVPYEYPGDDEDYTIWVTEADYDTEADYEYEEYDFEYDEDYYDYDEDEDDGFKYIKLGYLETDPS